jgi:predicted nucleotidyltransferase
MFAILKEAHITMPALIEKLVEVIVRSVEPDKIILFGSRAAGNFGKDSDYDLCVIKNQVKHRRRMAQSLYKSLYGIGVPVDIIVETPERFEELRENPFLIYRDIARNGRVVYEKPDSRT